VKSRFQNLLSKSNLHRYAEDKPGLLGRLHGAWKQRDVKGGGNYDEWLERRQGLITSSHSSIFLRSLISAAFYEASFQLLFTKPLYYH
jgi:hypothetical protein